MIYSNLWVGKGSFSLFNIKQLPRYAIGKMEKNSVRLDVEFCAKHKINLCLGTYSLIYSIIN